MRRVTKPHSRRLKKLPEEVEKLHQAYPEATIELWSQDEHRIGLKPILPGLGSKGNQSAGRGPTALSLDVSLWLCRAPERKDELVAHADG
jgi:hypothetical protein